MKSIAVLQVILATSITYTAVLGQEPAQPGAPTAVQRGAEVFANTCASSFCHGANGTPGASAPRLAGRALDATYIERVVTYGVAATSMPAWGPRLTRQDLNAVIAYVNSLNGTGTPRTAQPLSMSGEAARGRQLFADEVMGFSRCALCHQVGDVGVPVAPAIARVPADVAQLRNLTTTHVSTARVGTDTFPALEVTQIRGQAKLYDLTAVPPVLRTVLMTTVQLTNGSTWRHSAVLSRYADGDLQSILEFLRAAGAAPSR